MLFAKCIFCLFEAGIINIIAANYAVVLWFAFMMIEGSSARASVVKL